MILQGTSHVVQLLSTKLKQRVTKNQVGTTFNAIRSKGIKSYLQFWFQSRLDLHPIKVKLNCVEVGSKKCAFEFQASFSFSSCSARTCQVAASEALCCGSSHLHHKVQTSSCRLWNTCCRNMSQLIVPCCLSPSEILPFYLDFRFLGIKHNCEIALSSKPIGSTHSNIALESRLNGWFRFSLKFCPIF